MTLGLHVRPFSCARYQMTHFETLEWLQAQIMTLLIHFTCVIREVCVRFHLLWQCVLLHSHHQQHALLHVAVILLICKQMLPTICSVRPALKSLYFIPAWPDHR